ncbi:hypothetical protein ICE98_00290 [Lactococcus lactis]|nr:hypothetical protein [Lactococcus lactis]
MVFISLAVMSVMWDFPDNEKIQAIARVIYNDGGYLTSVYHGIDAALKYQR